MDFGIFDDDQSNSRDELPQDRIVLTGDLATAADRERIREALEGTVKPEAIVCEH